MEAKKVTTTTAAEGRLGMELNWGNLVIDYVDLSIFRPSAQAEAPAKAQATQAAQVARAAKAAEAAQALETAASEAAVTAETERGLALVEAMVSREQRGPDRVFVAGDASAEVWLPRSRMTELPLVPVGAGLAGLPSVPMQPRVTELPSVLAQARLAVGLPLFPTEAELGVDAVTRRVICRYHKKYGSATKRCKKTKGFCCDWTTKPPMRHQGNVLPVGGITKVEPHIRWSTAVVNPVPGRDRGAQTPSPTNGKGPSSGKGDKSGGTAEGGMLPPQAVRAPRKRDRSRDKSERVVRHGGRSLASGPSLVTVPRVVGVPGLATAPSLVGVPGLATAPSLVGVPGLATAPSLVGVPGLVTAPSLVGVPSLVALPGLVTFTSPRRQIFLRHRQRQSHRYRRHLKGPGVDVCMGRPCPHWRGSSHRRRHQSHHCQRRLHDLRRQRIWCLRRRCRHCHPSCQGHTSGRTQQTN